ncbi:hypothetical protein EJ02DRAFT_445293 [Clathrospora elynae]|uniref:Dienelactone hydrolase domain-containing protein n=1 Tax=Clathrospora elynae TaxID=706981 RepID=A0A6A5SLN5_9PLEO|nr:hypothetical protein EJ02DRAFT_445293 [Clathrospora elynae]
MASNPMQRYYIVGVKHKGTPNGEIKSIGNMPFPAHESFSISEYVKNKMPRPETVDPMYEQVIKHFRDDLGVRRLGGLGYCFGGKYVCRWFKEGGLKNGGLDAGFTAHPSFVDAEEVEGIRGPLSIAAAETDVVFPAKKRRKTEDILEEYTVPYQMFLYSGVEHGFGVKGDFSNKKAMFAKEQAFLQAVYWFDEYVRKEQE